ncbi:MAG: DNA primase [Deltaproteobacteria bacterium]|nr:MAG: DNA primase [Deltaproteobacteria bacterium]
MDRESYESVKEEIKRSADIVDLVGNFVQLRKAGKNYVGLCPFHSEKEPSFTVNRERQMFHCFGCKKGGDIFAFWMAYHHCSFGEALKDLAERYQVPLPKRQLSLAEKRRLELTEAIFKANEKAVEFFHQMLVKGEGAESARAYLEKRGIVEDTIEEFKLGFAPRQWDSLAAYLMKEKVAPGVAEAAGLIILGNKGRYYDRFRNRIIFPIFDLKGRPVGFGGRVLDDGHPKYLNTPETPVFQKGSVLYGLQASYTHMRTTRKALIVEGYMDFLTLWKHGLKYGAATLGTALTPAQVRRLKGYVNEIIVVFDSDEAGRKAVLRGLPIFINEGVQARAILLPEGHDPDSFLRARGGEHFVRMVNEAAPLLDFYLNQTILGKGLGLEEKVALVKELLPSIYELKDPMLRSAYLRKIAEEVGVKESLLWQELDKEAKRRRTVAEGPYSMASGVAPARKYNRDMHLLNLLIYHPEVASGLSECQWELFLEDECTCKLIRKFFEKLKDKGAFPPEQLLEELTDERARNELREALMLPSFYDESSAKVAASDIRRKIDEIRITSSIREARERGDMEELNALLKQRAKLHKGMLL